MDVLNPSHHWVLCLGLIKPPISIPQEKGDGGAFPCLHWVSVWEGNPRAAAKLHPCDLSSIVWVSWGKPGYWLINLFAWCVEPELVLLGGDTWVQEGKGWQKETFTAQPRAGRWKYFHYVPRYPTPAVRAQRALLCLVLPGNEGGTRQNRGLPKPAFSLGTIQPLWKKTLGTKNKAWSFKSRLPELLRKTSKWCH